MNEQSSPIAKALTAAGGATIVNVVTVTEWLQLLAALCAAIYSLVVLVEWFLKRRKKK
jgi:hypothetical protein